VERGEPGHPELDGIRRGDLVLVAIPGDHGKPRPTLVLQSDLFNDTHASITVVPVTSTIVATPLFRLTVDPSPGNGLRAVSQIMIDTLMTVRRDRLRRTIGRLDDDIMLRVNRAWALWLGLVT
jgi:mRNA interferase MazF